MTSNPVGWFEIHVADMARARSFYEAVFRLKLERINLPEMEMWAFPMVENATGAAGALVKMPGYDSAANSVIIYFSCEDCALEEARVEASGGLIQQPKMAAGDYGFFTLAVDTEGNMFGLHSHK